MCSLFLSVNITISRFVLTLPSVGEIEECAAVHLQRDGRRWKTSRQIYKHILALNEFSQTIFVSVRKNALNFELLFHCLR